MKKIFIIVPIFLLLSLLKIMVGGTPSQEKAVESVQNGRISKKISPKKMPPPSAVYKIPLPSGYQRVVVPENSFSAFVQKMPLKDRNWIALFNGDILGPLAYDMWGVVNIPLLFTQDLEQCADYAMRIWAEYHKAAETLDNFYLFKYGGQKEHFSKSKRSYTSFLKRAFVNSNSHSLKKGCKVVEESDLLIGDMVVQNEKGGIGHVSMIVDICQNEKGEKLYLMGYSFMPAQEFHVEKATDEFGIAGWFPLEGYYRYLEVHMPLGAPVLRRF